MLETGALKRIERRRLREKRRSMTSTQSTGRCLPGVALCCLALLATTLSGRAQVANPVFNPPSGAMLPVSVTLTDPTPGAQIYYTLDTSVPTNTSTLYTAPLPFTNYASIRARAFASGQGWSDTITAEYFNWNYPPGVSYQREILYDSNQPLVNVVITGASNVSCFTIEERLQGPIQPTSVTGGGNYLGSNNMLRWGPYTNMTSVGVTYRVSGLPGTFSLDGSASVDGAWTFSPPVMQVIISPPVEGATSGPPPQTATPVFTPPSGTSVPTSITVTDATPGAVIYYTLDGSLPTQGSMLYTGPVPLASAAVVRARAFTNGWLASVASVAYYGPPAVPANAQVTRSVGTNSPGALVVTLNAAPGTDASCFALEERLPPGLGASNVTAGGIYLASNNVVRWGPFLGTNAQVLGYQATGLPGTYPVQAAWSVDGVGGAEPGATNLVVVSGSGNGVASETLQVSTPTFMPASGSTVPVSVSMSCATPGGTIYFTLDGSLPTQNSMLYTGAVPLATATVIRARAFTNGWLPSVASVAYYGPPALAANAQVTRTVNTNSPNAPTMNFNVVPGTNAACFSLEEQMPPGLIASNVTAGGVYLANNSVVRWGPFFGTNAQLLTYQPIALPGTYPVRAFWSVDGVGGREAAGTQVVIGAITVGGLPTTPQQEPTPVLSPAISAALPVTVSISSVDPLAQTYFTTDGSLPTEVSALYTAALTFDAQTSLRARSFRAGYLPSVAALGEYVPVATTNSLQVVRSISGNGTFLPSVTITATPQGNIRSYSVTEVLPPGLTPSGLGAGAIWNPTNNSIRWGPYLDNQSRFLAYNLIGMSGSFPLAGSGSFDGYAVSITGAGIAVIDTDYSGAPSMNYAACAVQPFTYTVNINPAPGLVVVDTANGTLDWGDGTHAEITAPVMVLQKQYTNATNYAISLSADWTGHTTNGVVSGHATRNDTVQAYSECNGPTIVGQPTNQVVLAGTTAQFEVTATSFFPISYQWYFERTNLITGATATALTLPFVMPASAGQFSVLVTNAYGSATSSIATLVIVVPVITNFTRNVSGSFSLTMVGLPDSTSRILAATNLRPPIVWQPVFTNNNVGPTGTWQFTDTNVVGHPARFYRVSTP
jgi:hypothetical protein